MKPKGTYFKKLKGVTAKVFVHPNEIRSLKYKKGKKFIDVVIDD